MEYYQNEIFNFLTRKENFQSVYEISLEYTRIKKQLVEQFWQKVFENLKELSSENSDWDIKLDDDVYYSYSKLAIWFNDDFGVAYEKLHGRTHIGLINNFNNKNLDFSALKNHANKMLSLKGFKQSNWYLGYDFISADFDAFETLTRILPDNRDEYAKELAQNLYDFAIEVEPDVHKMSKMIIKQ